MTEAKKTEEVKKQKHPIPDEVHAMAAEIGRLIKVDAATTTSGDPETPIYTSMLGEDLTPDMVGRVRNQDALFGQAIYLAAGRAHIEAMAGTESTQMKGSFDMLGGAKATVVTNRRDEYRPGPNATSTDSVVYHGTTRSEISIDMGAKKSTDAIGKSLRALGAEVLAAQAN